MFKVGKVSHYYDKLSVAIIDLDGTLSVGDKVKFARGGEDLFEQKVESIQIEHEKKDSAGKGDVVGLKTNEAVKEGTEVFKI
ncbi:MAG: translation elongation factor-like protein [Candidatus Woesebacteria bacterium]|nr:translation elongation factor-like protein [Candidatus Woesebacteria bacterium]